MAAAIAAAADRGAERVPVRGLTVLYDARCSLCTFLRDWLGKQRQLVPLGFVPAGSEEAWRRFPSLDHRATLEEITIVGDGGQVYRGSAAWVVCLWALREHRPLAHRLSTPAGARLARGAVLAAAKWRGAQYRSGGNAGRQWGGNGGNGGNAGRQWGGSAYYGVDGWVFDPRQGWTYTPPATSPDPSDGGGGGGGCDSGTCPTG